MGVRLPFQPQNFLGAVSSPRGPEHVGRLVSWQPDVHAMYR